MSKKVQNIVNSHINNPALREEALEFVLKGLKQQKAGGRGWQTLAAMTLCETFRRNKARAKRRAKAQKRLAQKAVVDNARKRVDFGALAMSEREREERLTLKLEVGESTTLEWDGRIRKNQLHVEEQTGVWVRVVMTQFAFLPFSWEYDLTFKDGLCTIKRTA